MKAVKWISILSLAVCACDPSSGVTPVDGGTFPDATSTTDSAITSAPTNGMMALPTSGAGLASSSVTWRSNSPSGTVWWMGGAWTVPIPCYFGDAISTLSVPVRDNGASNGWGDSPNSVRVDLVVTGPAGTSTLATWTSLGSGFSQTATFTPNRTLAAGESMFVVATPFVSGGGTVQHLSGIDQIMVGTSATRTVRFRPQWLQQGPFVTSTNPTGGSTGPSVWRSAGPSPANASFEIPFRAGETIIALGWDAYGTGVIDNSGLGSIDVFYQPSLADTAHRVQPAATFDVNRPATWGQVSVTPFAPTLLSSTGFLWVNLEVDAIGYYIGDVTVTFATGN